MKLFLAVFFLCSVGFSQCAESPVHSVLGLRSAKVLNDLLDTHLHDKRSTLQRRQTVDQILACNTAAVRAQCESSVNQRLIDSALNCGQNGVAEYLARSCSTNSGGDYCADVAVRELQDLIDVTTSCAGSTSSCSSSCANALRAIRSSYGCCVNVYNTSSILEGAGGALESIFAAFGQLNQFFNYSLWSTCGVPTIGLCDNTPTITPRSDSLTCTIREYFQQAAAAQCNSEGQEIVDALLAESNCGLLVEAAVVTCSQRPDGEYCSAIVSSQLAEDTDIAPDVTAQCSLFQQACSSQCRSAVQGLRDDLGCCVTDSYLNSTAFQGAFTLQTTYGVWTQCNVDIPGPCENVRSGTKAFTSSLLLISVLAALLQYMLL